MIRLLVISIAAALLLVPLIGNAIDHEQRTHAPTCQEDMSCWDCRTMGNHLCGPAPLTEEN
jgi:hypothetical protein